MLLELRIENLGIIEELGIVVPPGLSVITGETGAGKTLVVGALELLAGARADATLVRPGADEARVEGRFEDPMTGEEVVVARVLPADGRSRAYVDGRMATVAELSDLGTRLIDLHGQHAHQSLLAPAMQRAVLDTFAGPPALEPRAEYQALHDELRAVGRALDHLGGDERTRARELSLLSYQIDEIEAAGLSDPEEVAALEREEAALGRGRGGPRRAGRRPRRGGRAGGGLGRRGRGRTRRPHDPTRADRAGEGTAGRALRGRPRPARGRGGSGRGPRAARGRRGSDGDSCATCRRSTATRSRR